MSDPSGVRHCTDAPHLTSPHLALRSLVSAEFIEAARGGGPRAAKLAAAAAAGSAAAPFSRPTERTCEPAEVRAGEPLNRVLATAAEHRCRCPGLALDMQSALQSAITTKASHTLWGTDSPRARPAMRIRVIQPDEPATAGPARSASTLQGWDGAADGAGSKRAVVSSSRSVALRAARVCACVRRTAARARSTDLRELPCAQHPRAMLFAQMLAASAMPEGCSIDVSACGTP